jgi:hypothetical protein
VIVGKKSSSVERKARIEEMRKAQRAAERRRNLLVAGIAGVVVVALVAVVFAVIRDYRQSQDPGVIGVSAVAAACDPVETDKVSGESVHVGPGTEQPDKTIVKYDTIPPSSGEHYAQAEAPARPFYTVDDRPQIETLVHNLEHGYTIAWYAPDLPAAQIEQLKQIADLARNNSATGGKFIVSAWDDAYGALPAGKTVALSHWGAKSGYRQLCGQVSGEAVETFVEKYPFSDSPEPGAA